MSQGPEKSVTDAVEVSSRQRRLAREKSVTDAVEVA